MGDFNVGPENIYIKSFWDNFDMTNIKEAHMRSLVVSVA